MNKLKICKILATTSLILMAVIIATGFLIVHYRDVALDTYMVYSDYGGQYTYTNWMNAENTLSLASLIAGILIWLELVMIFATFIVALLLKPTEVK